MEVITKIIKDTNPKKAIGSDKIPPKIIKLLANIIIKILIKINKDIDNNRFC